MVQSLYIRILPITRCEKKSNKISRDYYENVGRQATKDFKRDNTQKYLYQSAKARAKQQGEEFTIKLEDIKIPEICPLLGIKMQYNENLKQDNSYSLDRIDSSKGYIPGNIWVVSLRANRIKNDATLEELELIVKNLKQYGRNNI